MAEVSLRTRRDEDEVGCPDGTTIIVRDLFFNTPARMKFMKSDTVEASRISAAVQLQALAHPEVAIQLIRDGKSVLSSVSFTTGKDGTVVFDLLSGAIRNSEAIDGTYILSEVKAPEGYEATSATWTVTIQEDDGETPLQMRVSKLGKTLSIISIIVCEQFVG